MTSNEFVEYYKSTSNAELLRILDNPGDYQPLAIEAAKKEFTTRQLSEEQINEARELLISQKKKIEKNREKTKAIEEKFRSKAQTLLETLNPIQTGIPTSEKIIRFIVIVLGGLFLYNFITDFRIIRASFEDFPEYPGATTFGLLPVIVLPLGVFTFWKRRSVGWTLLVIFLVFSAVTILWVLIMSLLEGSPSDSIIAFPNPPIFSTVLQLLFFTGMLYAVCRPAIRIIYRISENEMIKTIAITATLTFFIAYAFS